MKYRFSLGAKRNPIRDLPEYHVSAIPLPAKVLTDVSMMPRLNQGQQPSCVGHAMANAVAYDYWKKTGHVPLISPRFIYARAKLLDGDPTGEGTSAYYAFEGISQFGGAPTTATVPNDVALPCDEYMVVEITDPITQEAKLYPVKTEVEIQNPTDAQLQSLISQYGVICIACDVDEETWMNQNGNVSLLPGTAGGHETILFGYDTTVAPSTQYDDLNSWGSAWGQDGTGKLLWSDYQGQIYDAMVITIDMTASNPILKLGSTGEAVKTLQTILGITADGSFGVHTLAAVEAFQASHGLVPDGIVGAKTWAALEAMPPSPSSGCTIQPSTTALIAGFEGFSATPYQDQGGVWTIGYGATYDANGNPVTANTPAITEAEGQALMAKQLVSYANAVSADIRVPLNQNQFDACCSLCYNIGTGGFAGSSVARDCNAGNFPDAAQAFLLWDKVNGEVNNDLVYRRNKEMELFLTPVTN